MEKVLNLVGKNNWTFSFTPMQTARYKISFKTQGQSLDGVAFNETIMADDFYYPSQAEVESLEKKIAAEKLAAEAPAPEEKLEPEAETPIADNTEVPADDAMAPWLLYTLIAVGNILVFGLAFFAYKTLMGSKQKKELGDIEKALAFDPKSVKKDAATNKKEKVSEPIKSPLETDSVVIDVSEDTSEQHIPMSDNQSNADELMADNLFPLDSIDESTIDENSDATDKKDT
jgi:hypothetical protein